MNFIKTSYYQSLKLDPSKHLIVQTSNGDPRFGTFPEWEMKSIAPPLRLFYKLRNGGLTMTQFEREYYKHLDNVGVDAIRAELRQLNEAAGGRDIVLCCFEALKKPGQSCHRRMFAYWWYTMTGTTIEEL